jgi:hypothetical protein
MTLPLTSCIVPIFNGGRYLREALDSSFNQTYRPGENRNYASLILVRIFLALHRRG